jgi:hypothetical protein
MTLAGFESGISAGIDRKKGAPAKPGAGKLERLKTTLEGAAKSRLIAILLGIAKKDRIIRDELLMLFSGETDLLDSVHNLIESSINGAMDRGFVKYRDMGRAIEGAKTALEIAVSKNSTGDFIGSVSVCIVILREMLRLLACGDDSAGKAGGVISSALMLMRDGMGRTAAASGSEGGDTLFDLVFNHAVEKIYDGWDDWRFEMLDACVPFCADPSRREKMESWLDTFVLTLKGGSYDNWASRQAEQIRHDIIEQFDGPEAAEAFVEKNLEHNENFRNMVIGKAIAAENYDRALRLCLEGEQKYEKYPGLVRNYRHKRYEIYELLQDIISQKELGRAFALDGEFDYFKKLKGLYTKAEWPGVLADLIENLEKKPYTSQAYIDICVHEHLDERLLELCRERPNHLAELYPHLVPQYAEELAPLFTARIVSGAKAAGGRNEYHSVCELIGHYIKACGKQGAETLIAELRETYRRRPAFVDELERIKV